MVQTFFERFVHHRSSTARPLWRGTSICSQPGDSRKIGSTNLLEDACKQLRLFPLMDCAPKSVPLILDSHLHAF
jgi:hypothetical protein